MLIIAIDPMGRRCQHRRESSAPSRMPSALRSSFRQRQPDRTRHKEAGFMSQREIVHFVFFPSPPGEVFEVLMDEMKHAAFSGAPAKIERRAGGKFSVFGGMISGVTTELKSPEFIVQDWRYPEWLGEQVSRVSFTLQPVNDGRGCALSFRHNG